MGGVEQTTGTMLPMQHNVHTCIRMGNAILLVSCLHSDCPKQPFCPWRPLFPNPPPLLLGGLQSPPSPHLQFFTSLGTFLLEGDSNQAGVLWLGIDRAEHHY